MNKLKEKTNKFHQAIGKLGFEVEDDAFFLTKIHNNLIDPQIQFHIDIANKSFNADAIFLRKQLNGSYKSQVYLYDFTGQAFNENILTQIQKKIWSSGEVPLVAIFYDAAIKIIDCTTHIKDNGKPEYLFDSVKQTAKIKQIYNDQFAIKIKSGVFWEEEENKRKFEFKNSSYDKLIENIRSVINQFKNANSNISIVLINKIIIQSILIKYLEERIDDNGGKLLSEKFFKKYNSSTFNEVLRNNKFVELLVDLNDPIKGFNGNVFDWNINDKQTLSSLNLSNLADLLDTNKSLNTKQIPLFPDWRYFEFKYIPVELISRLYEEFLASTDDQNLTQDEKKKKEGTFYTPSHLVKLLVDEVLPLKKFNEIDLSNYKILDPSCGSGIFLVIAFKRLVQIWRLQNEMKLPSLNVLKSLLKNVYGVDKEEQAVQLASFSLCLALCNELKPIEIITKLKFDDLRKSNIIHSDFFLNHKLTANKFDLVIGNPPFVRGGAREYENNSTIENELIEIPSNQLALKFLVDTYNYLKPNGLQCLIVKSSSLLYNSTSSTFKEILFSKLNILQILDFTALARNNSLWDGADVAAAAMFIRKSKIDLQKNILHLTFRRTKATKERIVFEIDDYDLHFINRKIAIENDFVWKNNLLGGGRIKTLISKLENNKIFKDYIAEKNCIIQEGHGTLNKVVSKATKINKRLLSTDGIINNSIPSNKIEIINEDITSKIVDTPVYFAPNIIISETLDLENGKIKFALNKEDLIFKNRYVGISSLDKDISVLNKIHNNLIHNHNIYLVQILVKSAQALINLNTAILAYDIYNLKYVSENNEVSDIDLKVSNDVVLYYQKFLRNGERSAAVKPVSNEEKTFKHFFINYGTEFCKILNLMFEERNKKFRLSDVITLNNSFIATIFRYDSSNIETVFHNEIKNLDEKIIEELSNHKISAHLSSNRIIKIYAEKDTIVFIKPNQQRYWLSLIAYRDADKCFADYSKAGY
jgi:methylase of polypeptide subunit release factors